MSRIFPFSLFCSSSCFSCLFHLYITCLYYLLVHLQNCSYLSHTFCMFVFVYSRTRINDFILSILFDWYIASRFYYCNSWSASAYPAWADHFPMGCRNVRWRVLPYPHAPHALEGGKEFSPAPSLPIALWSSHVAGFLSISLVGLALPRDPHT